MKQISTETIGDAKIVIAETSDGYVGKLWQAGKPSEEFSHKNLEQLKAQLRNLAGKLHPDYFGIDGAKARFRTYFPQGFDDPAYMSEERDYKDKARASLLAAAPLEQAIEADEALAIACRRAGATNLLSTFESARLNELLGSREGPAFVQAAAAFAIEPSQQSLTAMERAIEPHGRSSWPLVTYFPYFWAPDTQMFLKPEATKDFAVRTGHHFAQDYDPALDIDVYWSLLDLAATTEHDIADLEPRDRIDVQSFIWVVGSYTDADLPEAG